jgi:transcriptional regulator with XRE-family HTH domain
MTMTSTYPVSTFGHIYHNALQVQLQKMGITLSLLRTTRQEDINSVATAINIRPEILEKIENGQHDVRVKTLFALCDYYNVDLKAIVGKGELLNLKYE